MAWQGSKNNPVPNIGNVKGGISQKIAEDSPVLTEKIYDVNRAHQVRRDTDNQKDFTIGLEDIDTAVMRQIEKLQLTITDDGNRTKVPSFYASPEKWKSIQVDGVIRDYNGKLILPAIVLQRVNSDKDETMAMFYRYLTYPVIRTNSPKNRYTKFSILAGKNAPVYEIYDVVMPKHMVFTYHFIIWTEYIEQMNELVERFNFETDDYWGDVRGLRFRTKIQSFSHTVELQVDQDRIVKTEFDLILNGYLLPDIIDKMRGREETTRKWFTPKKIIFSSEIVNTVFNPNELGDNSEKWRSQSYPNLPNEEKLLSPPVSFAQKRDIMDNITGNGIKPPIVIPSANIIITEDNNTRITENGDIRVTES